MFWEWKWEFRNSTAQHICKILVKWLNLMCPPIIPCPMQKIKFSKLSTYHIRNITESSTFSNPSFFQEKLYIFPPLFFVLLNICVLLFLQLSNSILNLMHNIRYVRKNNWPWIMVFWKSYYSPVFLSLLIAAYISNRSFCSLIFKHANKGMLAKI